MRAQNFFLLNSESIELIWNMMLFDYNKMRDVFKITEVW